MSNLRRDQQRADEYADAKAKAKTVNDLVEHVFKLMRTRNAKRAFAVEVKRFAGNLLATTETGKTNDSD